MPETDKRLERVLDLVARIQEDNADREQLMPVWNARVAKLKKAGVELANEIVRNVQTGSAKNAADLLKKLKNYPDLKRNYDGLVTNIESANSFIGNITKQKYKLWKKNIEAYQKQEKEDKKEISKSRDTSPAIMQTNVAILAKYKQVEDDKALQDHVDAVKNEAVPKLSESELKNAIGSVTTASRYFNESEWDI
jgi:predicted nuclease with TOPRIM domain